VCVVCAMFVLRVFLVMCRVLFEFCVMCEVRCLPFVYMVVRVLWCWLCDCVLCVVLHVCVLCYCVLLAVKSVICWFHERGCVYVVVCFLCVLLFLCCDSCVSDVCSLGASLLCVVRVVCMFGECCVTGVVVGGSVWCVVCLECAFVCCMLDVFCVACCVRGWECSVVCE